MYQFNIEDMTCGHCVSRVTKAVKAVDARAQIEISLRDKRVNVRSSAGRDRRGHSGQAAASARVLRPGGVVLTDWCDDYLACRICNLYLRLTNRAVRSDPRRR